MRINFIVEDSGPLKYLGCATAAKNLYQALSKKIDISYNDNSYDFDLCHFHTFGPKSIMYLKRFHGKSVITAHSTPHLNDGNLAFPGLVNWLYVPIYNKFDYIISVSKKCERELFEIGCTPPISTIYNGIDIDKFKPDQLKRKKFREAYNIPHNSMVVLTVAQRTPRKGVYDFLKLASQFPEITFIWIGGFPYHLFSKDYRKVTHAIKNHPENAIFPGFVEDIFEVYSAADVFFMPSYAEGHSIVMLEALSMQLPMIARDLEEFKEAFDDIIMYFSKVEDIKKEMLTKKNLSTYKKKSEQIKKYHIDTVADEHIAVYEKVLKH